VETSKTSNGSQVVPAAALETGERPPTGQVDELPRYDLPLCIQTIGPHSRRLGVGALKSLTRLWG
jgi:hypothetical protein